MVQAVPDFPVPGVVYRDVLGLAAHPGGLQLCVRLMATHLRAVLPRAARQAPHYEPRGTAAAAAAAAAASMPEQGGEKELEAQEAQEAQEGRAGGVVAAWDFDAVVGCEAGGLVFAAPLALHLNKPLVVLRKAPASGGGKVLFPRASAPLPASHITAAATSGGGVSAGDGAVTAATRDGASDALAGQVSGVAVAAGSMTPRTPGLPEFGGTKGAAAAGEGIMAAAASGLEGRATPAPCSLQYLQVAAGYLLPGQVSPEWGALCVVIPLIRA
jgi:adenine/guanine phosphoribosyltransferase-like PRPP-binding protein